MYTDVVKYCSNCPQCAIVNGSGHVNKPSLSPIPVQRPFQIIEVDVMDLPVTELGNRHVVVFQDFLAWPFNIAHVMITCYIYPGKLFEVAMASWDRSKVYCT